MSSKVKVGFDAPFFFLICVCISIGNICSYF